MQGNDRQSEFGSHTIHLADTVNTARDQVISRISWSQEPADGTPVMSSLSEVTVAQYVAAKFLPEHVAVKTISGRRHFQAILKHILTPKEVDRMFGAEESGSKAKLIVSPGWPYLSDLVLANAEQSDVQRLISAAAQKGYSAQTIRHIRNVIGAIFSHAIKQGSFARENPASKVSLPRMARRESHALTLSQTVTLLELMQYPEREIALMALLTDMNIAEICGLQWKHVNLTDHDLTREGQMIPPKTIVVRNQWYRGLLCSVPSGRRKPIPVPRLLISILQGLDRSRGNGWNDFVLATRSGRPVNQINLAARRLKYLGSQLEMPWISWQVLRRTRTSLAYEYGLRVQDELARRMAPATSIVAAVPPSNSAWPPRR